jgi:hypothetical protein
MYYFIILISAPHWISGPLHRGTELLIYCILSYPFHAPVPDFRPRPCGVCDRDASLRDMSPLHLICTSELSALYCLISLPPYLHAMPRRLRLLCRRLCRSVHSLTEECSAHSNSILVPYRSPNQCPHFNPSLRFSGGHTADHVSWAHNLFECSEASLTGFFFRQTTGQRPGCATCYCR